MSKPQSLLRHHRKSELAKAPEAILNSINESSQAFLRSSMKLMSAGQPMRLKLAAHAASISLHSRLTTPGTKPDSHLVSLTSSLSKPRSPDAFQTESKNLMTSERLSRLMKPTQSSNIKGNQTTPGPGAYHYDLEIGGVSYAIGKANRVRDRKKLYVGPGNYELSASPAGIMYSMSPRRKPSKDTEKVPGPGTYSPGPNNPGVKFSVGRAKRHRERAAQSPGPGSYTVSRPGTSRSALTVKSSRPALSQVLDTPGPGTYHFDLKIGGPEMSLCGRREFKSRSIEPGPGSYTPVRTGMSSPAWGFGSSKKRLQFNDYTVPDPSWYHNKV